MTDRDPLERAKKEARKRLEPGGDHDKPYQYTDPGLHATPKRLRDLIQWMWLAEHGLVGGKDDGEEDAG